MNTPIGDKTDRDLHPAGNGTGPQPATGARAAPKQPAQAVPQTTMNARHNDLVGAWQALGRVLKVTDAIVADPDVDALVAEVLEAAHAGVAAEYFRAAASILRAERQQGSGPQPSFLPAPDGSEAM